MKKEFVTINSADDYIDNRTYNFEDYAKEFAEGEKINSRPYKDIILFNQGGVPSCTRHALIHINNGQNINEYKANGLTYNQLDPMDVWNRGDKRKFLISALDQAKKEGLIEGYLEIRKDGNMFANIDKALGMGCYIYTGSDNGTWGIYRKPYIYKVRTDGKIVGHAFPIVDKREDGLYVSPTSFGKSYGDKGYIYINPEDVKGFFTLFAIIDKDETGKFARFKNKEKVKQLLSIASDIYSSSDGELKQYFDRIQLSSTLKPMFGL